MGWGGADTQSWPEQVFWKGDCEVEETEGKEARVTRGSPVHKERKGEGR